ncbi:hypothetical protein PCANB_002928 [Pneumocystis canis]|nr:hypothetical protein PCANB_002928 [Pneumocystis canis]
MIVNREHIKKNKNSMLKSTSICIDIDEDKADLGVLDETLKKTNELTDKISIILTRLNHRLEKIEHTIKPIFKTISTLRKGHENIQGTIAAVERTRKYFNIVPEAEEIIKKGPDEDLTLFLDTLKKIKSSLIILRTSNFRSSEKSILRLACGCLQLYEIFRNSLLDFSIPVEPLHYTTKSLEFPLLPRPTLLILMSISSFFCSTSPDSLREIEKDYCDIRGGYTSESLKLLAQASLNTAIKREIKMYEKNSNGFIVYTQALLGMLKSESLIARDIFPENYNDILLMLIHPAIVTYCDTVQKLDQHIHQNIITDFTLAYEIFEELTKIINIIDLYGNKGPTVNELNKSIEIIKTTGIFSLSDIIERIRRSSAIISISPDGNISEITAETIDEYLESWKGCAEHLLDVTYVKGGIPNSVKLSLGPKERDIIKEKFKNFNNEFDELLNLNKTFIIYDLELKYSLIGEVKRILVPLYTRFYDKYFNSEFSKHQEKENKNISKKTRRYMGILNNDTSTIFSNITNTYLYTSQFRILSINIQKIIYYLSPLPSMLQAFYHCKFFKLTDSTMIPMLYIREKIPEFAPEHWLNLHTCTHYLSISPYSDFFYPIHDIILTSQCVFMSQKLFNNSTSNHLIIKHLPHPPSFFIILYWLYTNNIHQLYNILLFIIKNDKSLQWIQGFSMNIRFLGIIHYDLINMIKKILYQIHF